MNLTKTLEAHEAELALVTSREAKAALAAVKDTERDLVLLLNSGSGITQRAQLAQLIQRTAALRLALESRLTGVIDLSVNHATRLSVAHVVGLASDAGTALTEAYRGRAAVALAQQSSLLLHRHSIQTYGQMAISRIQAQLTAGVIQLESPAQLVARLRRMGGAFALNRHQAQLIVRMEMSRTYNQAAGEQVAILHADDPKWRKRIVEIRDANTHPFSKAANGVMAKPGERYKVPESRVIGKGSRPLWQKRGGFYRGMRLPAHFGERGREVPWHLDWPSPEVFATK